MQRLQPFEVLVDKRQEPVEGLAIAVGVGHEELGNIGFHGRRVPCCTQEQSGSA